MHFPSSDLSNLVSTDQYENILLAHGPSHSLFISFSQESNALLGMNWLNCEIFIFARRYFAKSISRRQIFLKIFSDLL